MYYLTAAQIADAINRANPTSDVAGTYRLVGTWVGNVRVWMAERIEETSGYEVAYDSIDLYKGNLPNRNLYTLEEWERVGAWWDEETGELCIDRTMHIRGTRSGVAHDVARIYNQKAIWSWHRQEVEMVEATCTAL